MSTPTAPAEVRDYGPGLAVVIRPDRMHATVVREMPKGVLKVAYERAPGTGPFTDEDFDRMAEDTAAGHSNLAPGEKRNTYRRRLPFGVIAYTQVCTGPPRIGLTLRRDPDGTYVAGWRYALIAVAFKKETRP